jgi:hypothetical protein
LADVVKGALAELERRKLVRVEDTIKLHQSLNQGTVLPLSVGAKLYACGQKKSGYDSH